MQSLVWMIAVVLLLGACAAPGRYYPRTNEAEGGYSEQRLDESHWRVEFAGDAATSQDVVETYLLYRAAELTVASGYDWFLPSQHALVTETELVIEASPVRDSPVWRPLWRQRRRFGWTDWMPRGAPPREPSQARSWLAERHVAREDIAMGCGPPPTAAFDARFVLERLGPSILRPVS